MREINSNNLDILDILKFVLSIMIVAIHTSILIENLYPWLRVAVPIFFIIVSYLFFKKVNSKKNVKEKAIHLKVFIKRNLSLYLFWFIVLSPATFFIREWFEDGIGKGIILLLRDFLFSSTFRASWFIVASIICVSTIFLLTRKLSNRFVFWIALLIYVLVCMRSSYMFILKDFPSAIMIINIYDNIFAPITNSFPAGFIWIIIGKIIADNEERFDSVHNIQLIAIILISSILLFMEWKIVYMCSNALTNDFYFSLLPLSIALFTIIKRIDVKCKYSMVLRKVSTITYVTHATIATVVFYIFNMVGIEANEICIFFITLICSFCIAFIILLFEKKKPFGFLKWSY